MSATREKYSMPCQKERSFLLDILLLAFGMGAWVSVTGFWVELPLLIDKLPEGWGVSSQLSVAQQLANIGPIIWIVISCLRKDSNNDGDKGFSLKSRQHITYSLLTVGIVANILFAFEWNAKVNISGTQHSLPLIILMFIVGLIGCTASVLFMPQVAIFPKGHLVSYLVGEGLGGFLPSIVSLIQGAGKSITDINMSSHGKGILPRFNPTIYFLFIASLMLFSLVSFFLLNNLPSIKKEMIHSQRVLNHQVISHDLLDSGNADDHENCQNNLETSSSNTTAEFIKRDHYSISQYTGVEKLLSVQKGSKQIKYSPIHRQLVLILLNHCWDSFFSNGFLPGVTTFSILPYSNQAFLLSSTIGSLIVPISNSLAFFKKDPLPITIVAVINFLNSLLSVYIIVAALYSPKPPLVGTTEGKVLIVMAVVLYQGLSAYIKVNAASICRELENSLSETNKMKEGSGRGPLFWCGAGSQCSGAIGAIVALILVKFTGIFNSV